MTDNYSVLMVDDDDYAVRPFADTLIDAGFSVKVMQLNSALVETLKFEKFDLVILDIMMEPDGFYENAEAHGGFVTGKLLARDIRDQWPEQKIMALSLHRDAGIREWFNNQDGMIFVRKGRIDIETLPTLARTLIENEPDSWSFDGSTFVESIQLKPSIFGVGIDLKKAWSALKGRPSG